MDKPTEPDWGRWVVVGLLILLFVGAMVIANHSKDPTSDQVGPYCSADGNC